jgi:hypothetical protein
MYAGRGCRVKPKPQDVVVCNAVGSLHLVETPVPAVHAQPTAATPLSTIRALSSTSGPWVVDRIRRVVDESDPARPNMRNRFERAFHCATGIESPAHAAVRHAGWPLSLRG